MKLRVLGSDREYIRGVLSKGGPYIETPNPCDQGICLIWY